MRLTVRLSTIALAIAGLASTAASASAATSASTASAATHASAASNPGSRLWTASITDAQADGTHGRVLVSPDGSTVYVAGGANEAVTAYSATTGAALWTASNPAAASGFGEMALSPDGSAIFVTASNAAKPVDYETVAYDTATGATLWTADSPNVAYAFPRSIVVSPDGSQVYVTGWQETSTGQPSYLLTVAYDTATGDSVWNAKYLGPTQRSSFPYVAVSPDGSRLFVTGTTQTASGVYEYATVAFDTTDGSIVWARLLKSSANAQPTGLVVSPDSTKVYVTGNSGAGEFNAATVAYNVATGGQLWVTRIPVKPNAQNQMTAITMSPDGSLVYVTGYTTTGGTSFLTEAYNASTGVRQWQGHWVGPAGDNTSDAIAASPDGSTVYVTGQADPYQHGTLTVKDSGYGTVAYNATTGAKLWSAMYRGAAGQALVEAYSVAVSPDSSTAYVTGYANGRFTTVAYQG